MSKPTYAHFPGGGPSGATCMTCEHRGAKEHQGRSIHWCGKAARFTDTKPSQMGRLNPHSAACKYWEERRDAR